MTASESDPWAGLTYYSDSRGVATISVSVPGEEAMSPPRQHAVHRVGSAHADTVRVRVWPPDAHQHVVVAATLVPTRRTCPYLLLQAFRWTRPWACRVARS